MASAPIEIHFATTPEPPQAVTAMAAAMKPELDAVGLAGVAAGAPAGVDVTRAGYEPC